MDVNDDASCLEKRAVFDIFASKLAPTRDTDPVGLIRSSGP